MKRIIIKSFLFTCFILIFCFPLITHANANGYVDECLSEPEKCMENEPQLGQLDGKSESMAFSIGFLDVFKMAAALLFVIVLLYLMLKFINQKSRSYEQTRIIQNLGGTSLGGNRSVQLVKTGNRVLILGVGEEVNLLKEITDEKEIKQLLNQFEEQLNNQINPTDTINKFVRSFRGKRHGKNEEEERSFVKLFEQEMEAVKQKRHQVMDGLQRGEHDKDG